MKAKQRVRDDAVLVLVCGWLVPHLAVHCYVHMHEMESKVYVVEGFSEMFSFNNGTVVSSMCWESMEDVVEGLLQQTWSFIMIHYASRIEGCS